MFIAHSKWTNPFLSGFYCQTESFGFTEMTYRETARRAATLLIIPIGEPIRSVRPIALVPGDARNSRPRVSPNFETAAQSKQLSVKFFVLRCKLLRRHPCRFWRSVGGVREISKIPCASQAEPSSPSRASMQLSVEPKAVLEFTAGVFVEVGHKPARVLSHMIEPSK